MKFFSIFLIIFGVIIIIYPEFLAYLIGWFFVFVWVNLALIWFAFKRWIKEDYVKFGKYKIFR